MAPGSLRLTPRYGSFGSADNGGTEDDLSRVVVHAAALIQCPLPKTGDTRIGCISNPGSTEPGLEPQLMQAHSYEPASDQGDSNMSEGLDAGMGTKRRTTGRVNTVAAEAGVSVNGAEDAPVAAPVIALPGAADERVRRAHRARMALIVSRIGLDSLLLAASFAVAYWLRYALEVGRDVIPESFR